VQWRRQEFEPTGMACMFMKSDRNDKHFYINIVNYKTENCLDVDAQAPLGTN